MNRALIRKTDEERDLEIQHDKVILAVLKAMNEPDHFEPEEPRRWNPVAIVVLSYAAALCVVVAWVVVGRM